MKFDPKRFVLGMMITGGIALTAAGTRELSRYISGITIGEYTGMPPGFSLIILGSGSLCFAIGHITGELIKEKHEVNL